MQSLQSPASVRAKQLNTAEHSGRQSNDLEYKSTASESRVLDVHNGGAASQQLAQPVRVAKPRHRQQYLTADRQPAFALFLLSWLPSPDSKTWKRHA